MQRKSLFEPSLLLKGAGIGIANAVPGVSGGTIAVVFGIYDRIIDSVGGFFSNELGWKRNFLFLAQIAAGAAAAIFGFAHLMDWLMTVAPEPTQFWFIGLIVGSVPFLVRAADIERPRPGHWIAFALALALMLVLAFVPQGADPQQNGDTLELSLRSAAGLFGAGVVSAAAMIVPGISGSYVLLLFGLYRMMMEAISTMNLPLLAVFAAGAVVGLVVVTKSVGWLLRRYHSVSYAAIIGLVLGSVAALYPGLGTGWMILADAAAAAAGFGLAFLLGNRKRPPSAGAAPADAAPAETASDDEESPPETAGSGSESGEPR